LRVGPDAPVPVVHVEDVVSALLLAVQRAIPIPTPLNLVEDRPPSRWLLLDALNSATSRPKSVIRLPWSMHRKLAGLVGAVMRVLRLPPHWLPGLLDGRRVECSFKPLRYDNSRARSELGWRPARDILSVVRGLTDIEPSPVALAATEAAREAASPP
jgi:nucleoside-diphosphate-sugar epimerase